MMMQTVCIDAIWDEHVQGFMDESLIGKVEGEDYAEIMAGLGLIEHRPAWIGAVTPETLMEAVCSR